MGAKYKPFDSFALRGTYSRGFRAPSIPEQGSLAAFSGPAVNDLARCAALTAGGLPTATVNANCMGVAPSYVIAGSSSLQPEKSTSKTIGFVWDVVPQASLTTDLFEIKRNGLIVSQDAQAAINAGQVTRDPSTSLVAGDPGGILVGAVSYVNASSSTTRGLDVEFKETFGLGGFGKLSGGVTWTHLFMQRVIDADGTIHDYSGTHGNCDVTNCMGSPSDRVSLATTWQLAQWRAGVNVNYRGGISNKDEKAAACRQTYLNGSDAPAGCRIASFTTFDLSGGWAVTKNIDLSASIQNLFDKVPPFDPRTYGAVGYNPLDYSGAIGRYFRVTGRYTF